MNHDLLFINVVIPLLLVLVGIVMIWDMFKKEKKKEEKLLILFSVIFSIVVYFCIFLLLDFRHELIRNSLSITRYIIIFGIFGLLFFLQFRRKYIYGIDGNELDGPSSRFYYAQGLSFMRTIITGYIISLTLLWGFLMSSQKSVSAQMLMEQGIVLTLFVLYFIIVYHYSLIIDFRDNIKK
jgi:uncharacterized membrane protein YoaK (UPF0700 family)